MPQLYFLNGRWMSIEEVHQLRSKNSIVNNKQEEKPSQPEEPRNELQCPYCDFIGKSKAGLKTHIRFCKKKVH